MANVCPIILADVSYRDDLKTQNKTQDFCRVVKVTTWKCQNNIRRDILTCWMNLKRIMLRIKVNLEG